MLPRVSSCGTFLTCLADLPVDTQEGITYIFLRSGEKEVKSAIGLKNSDPYDVFVELRHRKDVFK